jgi:hypothetical protein
MASARPQAGEKLFRPPPAIRDRTSDRLLARLASLPVWAWLGGIVTASALAEVLAGRRIQSPLVFGDELIYWELARNFAAGGHFLLREVPTSVYGPFSRLYPALIAPAFPSSRNLTQAYVVVKEINAVLMSLAAIPVFFIARRVLSQPMALVAAALAVAIPSLVYTGMVMTENAAYPAFLLCALAIVRALERPTSRRQLAVLAAIVLAFVVRAQAVVLVPAYVSAILLLTWLESERGARTRALRGALASYRTTWIALVAGPAVVLAAELAQGKAPFALLGSYGVVGGGTHLTSVPRWFLYQLADLDLYVAAAPFAACCILLPLALRGLHGRPLRVFAVATVSLVAWLMVTVAQFSSTVWGAGRVHERNLFYVVPLILIGFLAYFDIDTARSHRLKLGALTIAAALPATLPFEHLVRGALPDTLALLPWANTSMDRGTVPFVMTAFAWVLAMLIFLPPRFAPILVFGVALNFYVIGAAARLDAHVGAQTLAKVRVDQQWIDDAVGPNAHVTAVWFPSSVACIPRSRLSAQAYGFWENEFFNRSVRRTFYVGRRLDGLPEERLILEPGTRVLIRPDGTRFSPSYVAVSDQVRLQAPVVAGDQQTRTALYRVRGSTRVVPPQNCRTFAEAGSAG